MSFRADPAWLAPQTLEAACALAAPFYTSVDVAESERAAIFADSWQLVAHTAQLSASGNHIVTEVAGVPLVVVRGDDGVLRALHNICRHRAGPLATCDGRGARALRCKDHGWTYNLDGRLCGAPEMGQAQAFDVGAIRLPQAQVAQWQSLVFVALEATLPLAEVLAGIDAHLHGHALVAYDYHHRINYEVNCNWKVYIDNYLEGYHVPHIHPALNRMLDCRSYTTELAPWYALQNSPLESAETLYGNGEALYYFIWPNAPLNILPVRLQTNRLVPLGVDRCRIDFGYLYESDSTRTGAGDAQQRAQDQNFSDEVQHEDIALCELVQQRLGGGSYFAGRLIPKRESGVQHFHELYRQAPRA